MKTAAGAFLAGAASRLLPASIPFRFFGAAVAYHVLAWLALLAGADGVVHFAGGFGWPLAALHLVTLGVLVMTAIGASLQLLPVATRQPLRSVRSVAAIWWLYTPGVAGVGFGMGSASPLLLGLGALAVALALLGFGVLLANNLRGARGMPDVVLHGWAALACLLVVLGTALSLALAGVGVPLLERATALSLHVAFAAYGFMGLLACGISLILVPMFALSSAPDARQSIASCAFGVAALALVAFAAFGVAPQLLRSAAIGLGGVAVALHLRLMLGALRSGMRRHLGRSFILVRIGWAGLAASLAAALGLQVDAPFPALRTLFGLALIVGWLLTFLLGILQRILPFLAAMHAAQGRKRAPTPSALSAQGPLALHFACHLIALAGLAAAVLADSARLAALAAGAGAIGACAFAVFFLILLRRMNAAAPASPPGAAPAA